MRNFQGLLYGMLFALPIVAADSPMPAGTAKIQYGGWTNCFEIKGGDCRAVVVPGVGGRILHYSVNGENVLYENPTLFGDTLHNRSNFWVGGYQLDLGPELRGIPDHKWLWQGVWNARASRLFTVYTVSDPEMSVGVQLEKEIVIDPDTGDIGLTQRMRNIVNSDVSFCLWDRTLCKGGGFGIFPLNKKSRFKAGWAKREGDKVPDFRYNGENPKDARVKVIDGVLVAEAKALPDSPNMKIGADSDAGWIAYARGKILFVKYFPYTRDGNYTDGGNSVEFYCNDRGAELEPVSPEVKLKSGENYSFPEKWTLIELDKEVTSHEQARALVKRIPKSPFGK